MKRLYPCTPKQKKQRVLAWKLRMVTGAKGNLYPREKELPDDIASRLSGVMHDLEYIEISLRRALKELSC